MKKNKYLSHCYICDCEPYYEIDAETGEEEEIPCPNCGGRGCWPKVTPVYEVEHE